MNLTLELTTEQIINFLRQMPPEEKLTILKVLAKEARAGRAERMQYAKSQVRQLCAERGLDWDMMTNVLSRRVRLLCQNVLHQLPFLSDSAKGKYANVS